MADPRLAAALAVLPERLGQHVLLSAAALALGLVVSLPLAVLAAGRPRLRWTVLTFASLVQTIPGLALLALFYPLLLAVSALTLRLFGLQTQALGFLPALLALGLYAVLPILRNTVAGLTGIDPAIEEAALGVGMTTSQKLWRVEVPLAAPVVMAGVRTAAVWTIGAATLSTPVGQTSLGDYIFSGLQTEDWVSVLFGCLAAAALALVADQLLGLVEAGVARRDRIRLWIGGVGLLAGVATALVVLHPSQQPRTDGSAAPPAYVLGAKNFSEQFILAELMGRRLRAEGAGVRRKDGLGSAVIFRALAAGEIDAYVDYSGTLWTNVLARADRPPRAKMLQELTRALRDRYGVTVLGPLGFENAYTLAMRPERARTLGVRDIGGLSRRAPSLVLGADLEFLSRPEWRSLRDAYGLSFRAERAYNPTFMYRALDDGEADVISAFSSDGRIVARGLVVLADPRAAIPPYDAVILVSPRRAHDERLRRALQPLVGRVPVQDMRRANLMVDRDRDKASPAQAAAWLAEAIGAR